jgi:hypothetical protein
MFIAKSEALERVLLGTEFQQKERFRRNHLLNKGLTCPACRKNVEYRDPDEVQRFDVFVHQDGSQDCFEAKSQSSKEHRLAVELSVKRLYNRLIVVGGAPIDIDVEKRVGDSHKFVISDIRVEKPVRIVAEVFYRTGTLSLRRRFDTLFKNNYNVYLIFHSEGRFDPGRVEDHLRQVATVDVGRFDSEALEVSLGGMFSESRVEMPEGLVTPLPNYIVR